MAKPNYRQAKRHKELARKARQEEKNRLRSTRKTPEGGEPAPGDSSGESPGESEQPSSAAEPV